MTKKQYRSAMGKTVDMGALLLQNETVRAVGNMGVNARGDVVDGRNRVIDKKTQQIQRQNRRTTNVSRGPISTGTLDAKKSQQLPEEITEDEEIFEVIDEPEETVVKEESAEPAFLGGLADAIARSRTVKQQLEKTPRQLARESGVKKI